MPKIAKDGYFYGDGTCNTPSADEINYDNSTSLLGGGTVQSAIDELASSVNTITSNLLKVLWENPNPTSEFGENTITLSDNLNNYDYYEIIFSFNTTTPNRVYSSGKIPSDSITDFGVMFAVSRYRQIISNTGNTLTFSQNNTAKTYDNNTTKLDNIYLIPLKVLAYKL